MAEAQGSRTDCPGDQAYIDYAKKRARQAELFAATDVAIAAALALYKRTASGAIADLQTDLARRAQKLAEKAREHAKKFWPYEDAFINDAFGEPKAKAQYQALSLAWGGMSDDAMNKGRTNYLDDMKQKCISVTDCEDNKWKRSQQLIKADVISHADRQAENREEALNDKRFARQYAALQLGRGYLGLIPSYQDLAGAAGITPKNVLFGLIKGGYKLWAEETFDNEMFQKDYYRMPAPKAQTPTIPATSSGPVKEEEPTGNESWMK